MIKTENQVYKDLITIVNAALGALDITDWQVLQLKQPVKLVTIKPTIYLTCTLKRRRGWQFRKDELNEDQTMSHTEAFKQEIDVQFSALRNRKITDTEHTRNSADILEYLKTYMLTPIGLQLIRNLGYEIYYPSEIQSPDFFNDSDNFEFMPFFNVTFILEQSLTTSQNTIDAIINKNITEIEGIKGV